MAFVNQVGDAIILSSCITWDYLICCGMDAQILMKEEANDSSGKGGTATGVPQEPSISRNYSA